MYYVSELQTSELHKYAKRNNPCEAVEDIMMEDEYEIEALEFKELDPMLKIALGLPSTVYAKRSSINRRMTKDKRKELEMVRKHTIK